MDGPEHFHWCSIRSLNKRVVQILTWNNLRFYSQTACGAMKMAVYWSLWSSSGTSSDFGGVATWGLYTLKKNERLVRLKVTNNWKNSNIIWTENLQPTTWFFNRRFFWVLRTWEDSTRPLKIASTSGGEVAIESILSWGLGGTSKCLWKLTTFRGAGWGFRIFKNQWIVGGKA